MASSLAELNIPAAASMPAAAPMPPPDLLRPQDECYAALYQRCKAVQRDQADPRPALFGVMSCESGEGVTTIAASIAIAAACGGERRVLLVDANFHRPRIADVFRLQQTCSLVDQLSATGSAPGSVGQPSGVLSNLSILPAGKPSGSIVQLYESNRLPTFLKLLPLQYSFVVFDLPSLATTRSSLRLAGMLGGVIVAVEAEKSRREVVRRGCELLSQANVAVLGGVLNKRREYVPGWLYRKL